MHIPQAIFHQLYGPGDTTVDLDAMTYGTAADRGAILALARCLQPKDIVEFGVQRGQTAKLLISELTCVKRYTGIDLPADIDPALDQQLTEHPRADAGILAADDPRFRLVLADTRTTRSGSMRADLVYVDGGHDRETLRADSAAAARIIRPGGIIIWHDYGNPTCPDVRQFIDHINETTGNHICLIQGTWVCYLHAVHTTVLEALAAA